MNEIDPVIRQAAVIAKLVQLQTKPVTHAKGAAPATRRIRRTALMKYVYLLQTAKGLPLDFDFTLYAYGPYDGAVLSRLSTAVRWKAVNEKLVAFPNGSTGYDLTPGDEIEDLLGLDADFMKKYAREIEWVVREFHGYNAGEMELIGTMVFADREAKDAGETRTKDELVDIVLRIKPRFTKEQAGAFYDTLKDLEVLVATRE